MILSIMFVAMLSACGISEKEDETVSEEIEDGVKIIMPHDNYYCTGQERPVGMSGVEELEELTSLTLLQ